MHLHVSVRAFVYIYMCGGLYVCVYVYVYVWVMCTLVNNNLTRVGLTDLSETFVCRLYFSVYFRSVLKILRF